MIKSLLTSAPIMQPLDWFLPFGLMCDASNYVVGTALGEIKEIKPFVIYHTSRTLNSVQMNYTITKKELLVVIFVWINFVYI